MVLQTQFDHLYTLLCAQTENGGETLVRQVTVVVPEPRHPPYELYYQKEKWLARFASDLPGVRLVYQKYVGRNEDHSYDQYVQACVANPHLDYHILMEDDYCFAKDRVDFDRVLVGLYRRRFPDNVGYLCSWAAEHNGHRYHAAISNGVVSADTWKRFPDPLQAYHHMSLVEKYSQLKFSYLFTENGIPLADFAEEFRALFWNSDANEVASFSPQTTTRDMILPVQCVCCDTTK